MTLLDEIKSGESRTLESVIKVVIKFLFGGEK